MMPDFAAVRSGQLPFPDAVKDLDYKELPVLAGQLYDAIDEITAEVTDQAVAFTPKDPNLQDSAEAGWTLGHVIVHVTAGLEELSAIAAMMARGVEVEGRLRYETPWETVTTVQQIRDRLKESRRITMAFFGGWPEEPHLDVTRTPIPRFGPMNAVATFGLGLFHTDSHLEQLREIMRQGQEL